ncbi:hypothetical protein [Achromobacter sp. 2789STDY5608628]|uniref:hypothetical protein n=1 Tax=Achromobacter sp. 2789STDY5608628 TaxID=1806493 RepID=UPI0006C379DE|nr:hypothetical protein [Achromobacter sp. 2789STDY5608628]CUJ54310.1 Uncharacterised protein [Achromobacter sp. 2789STDY5608628]
MTNQNNAAQAAKQEIDAIMEEAQAFASAWSLIGGRFDDGNMAENAQQSKQRLFEMVSKLRAPVADERAAFKKCHSAIIKALSSIARADGPDTRKEDDPELLYRSPVMDDVVRIRVALDECSAALASAPVADERHAVDPCGYVVVKSSAVDWLKDKFPALTIKAGLCERIGGRLYTITRLMRDHDAALASAPVAGEAQPVAWFTDWPDEPELGHYIAESPAANGRSRPLVFADAVPQAGETVYAYRRKGLNDFVTCDRERFDELSAKPRLFETRIFYAAPQASAEYVRNAALEEAAKVAEIVGRPVGAGDGDTYVPGTSADAARAIRALKQPQAAKGGGQQRAAPDHPVFAFLLGEGQLHGVDFGERAPGAVGKWWWRKDLRAALSATQPEQGERDA